jgi:hypothetical protein
VPSATKYHPTHNICLKTPFYDVDAVISKNYEIDSGSDHPYANFTAIVTGKKSIDNTWDLSVSCNPEMIKPRNFTIRLPEQNYFNIYTMTNFDIYVEETTAEIQCFMKNPITWTDRCKPEDEFIQSDPDFVMGSAITIDKTILRHILLSLRIAKMSIGGGFDKTLTLSVLKKIISILK